MSERKLLTKLWRAEYRGEPDRFHLFDTKEQPRGMLGECDGELYQVEVWRAEQHDKPNDGMADRFQVEFVGDDPTQTDYFKVTVRDDHLRE